jgi:hypothetical protein
MGNATNRPTIFVDANAIVKQAWFLDTPQWRLLRHQSRHGAIELVISEVAFREVVAKFRLELVEGLRALAGAQEKLHRLIDYKVPERGTAEMETLVADYREELQEILDSCNAVVAPIPNVNLAEFVDRAANRHRPFDSNGNGFRDALIWETVVEHLRVKKPSAAFLVSNDSAFYSANNDDTLHAELVSDAVARGASCTVQPWRFIGPYLSESFGTNDHALLSQITGIIEENHGSLSDALDGDLMSLVDGVRLRDGTSIEVAACERSHLRLGTAATTDDGPVLVNLIYTTDMTVRLFSPEPNSQELGEIVLSLEIPATTLLEHDADYFEPMVLESPVERVLGEIERAYPRPVSHEPFRTVVQGLQFPLIDERILNNLRGLRLPIETSVSARTMFDVTGIRAMTDAARSIIDFANVLPHWINDVKGINFNLDAPTTSDADTNSEEKPESNDGGEAP